MTDRVISEQALSPSSSEIMRKATRLVDQLLVKTKCDFPNESGASLTNKMDITDSGAILAEDDINCRSNSITDSETFSVFTSVRKNTPSIEIIKRLAGRLKNKDSDAISELNFPSKKSVTNGLGAGEYCSLKPERCRSKSASPTGSEIAKKNRGGLSCDFAQMNAKLSEINKRVESLSSNIEDIQDIDHLEDSGSCVKNEKNRESHGFDTDNVDPRTYDMGDDDNYLSQLNVAVLQQERLRMWAKDNAKYTSSTSNVSENGNHHDSEHIPFSDVYYTHQSLKYKSGEISSGGILNSSVLSTTASGTNGQFAPSNDTTVYETKYNDRNGISNIHKKSTSFSGCEDSEKRVSETGEVSPVDSSAKENIRSTEPKALRFIRVGDQLRRSITVTPLIESIQRALDGEIENADALLDDQELGVRAQFNSRLEKLSNSNIPTFNNSRLSPGYHTNMVIITLKDRGIEQKGPKKPTLDDTSSVDSAESDRNNFFSCRECSWNPTNACPVQ
ncbi:hypothetical protein OJ253_1966 [Cryptosporidium canis]|uniref:Uncharacterized protein n=1 Tax=Cryptosporidium canis TaxID=195482 RepID=A0A9D5DG62_9CRYT|nr:hypothetical protein OJ253_1966 [Cryptosporidium canis]